jgi:hypothetical protein
VVSLGRNRNYCHGVWMAGLFLALCCVSEASGQGSFSFRFRGFNTLLPAPNADTLILGRDPRATYCADPYTFYLQGQAFFEAELPPSPPGFDLRSMNFRSGTGGCPGLGSRSALRNDIRGSFTRTQIDTFRIKFSQGDGDSMKFSWPTGLSVFCDSMRFQDLFGGALGINVDMLASQSFAIDNSDLQLNVKIWGNPGVGLVSPANGSTVPPSPTLTWNTRPGATLFHLQVATDSLFTNRIIDDSTITTTSRALSGLSSPATFYWRVSAGNLLGFGAYSPFWRFTTGNIPSTPSLLFPANGSTGQPTSLTLRWHASAGTQTYHVQVSTDSNFTTLLVNDSTLTDTLRALSSLSFSTKYYWRARAKNGVGTSAFSSPFNFTTQFQPPPAPTLVSPSNGQTNVPILITLTWNVASGASTYRVQVATDSSFTTGILVDDSTLTTTSRAIGPLPNSTQFFWRVNAKNPGGPGLYSTVWRFTTIVAPPTAPVLVSPSNGAQNVSLFPTLVWNSAPTATAYRLQVALDSLFAVVVLDDSTITGTSRQVGQLLSITQYFWHVRAKNIGGSGPYSTRFGFITTAAPPAPVLLSPPDSATRVSRTPTMVWSRNASATSYHLQIAADSQFTTLLVNDSTIIDTFKTVPPLPYGARLLWRVRVRNTSGVSEFSAARRFTMMLEPPGVPALLSPPNNYVYAPVSFSIRWSTAVLAAAYHLQIALDTLMTNMFLNDSAIGDTTRAIRVAPSTAYYWRVRAANTESSYGAWSSVRRFSTASVAPAVPIPSYPLAGTTNVSRTPRLQWVESPGALSYRAQLSFTSTFAQIVAEDSTLTTTYYLPGLLEALRMYYWRVQSKGTLGSSVYSAPQQFTTGTLIVGVEEDPATPRPTGFTLHQNYPNPFNPSTTIPFELMNRAFLTLKVFDLLGREVRILVNEDMSAGAHAVQWDGTNSDGRSMPSGMYFVQMVATADAKQFREVRKVMMLK